MKRLVRIGLLALAAIAAVTGGLACHELSHSSLAPYASLELKSSAPLAGEITTPLHAPAKTGEYKEGGNYSFLVEHDGRTILIHAGANFSPGIYQGVRADVIFFGIGVSGKQSEQFAEDYWREVVQATGAGLIIPIHWDDFTIPLDQLLQPMPPLMDNFDRGMEMVQRMAERDGVAVRFMPLFEPVDILAAAARN